MKFRSTFKKLIAIAAVAATIVTTIPVSAADLHMSSAKAGASEEAVNTTPAEVNVESLIDIVEPKTATTASYPHVFSSQEEVNLLYYLNNIRLNKGYQPLSTFAGLQNCADGRLNEIRYNKSNTRPDGRDCYTVFDDFGVDWDWAYEIFTWDEATSYDALLYLLSDELGIAEDFVNLVCDTDFDHVGTSVNTIGSTPYYEMMFHGSCNPIAISIWNEQDVYYVPYGTSLNDMNIFVQSLCEHDLSYFPLSEGIISGYNPNLANVVQQVTIRYCGLTYTFDVMVYGLTNFTDVHPSYWYYSAVDYVYCNNIMDGKSYTYFGANDSITRGQFATILYRIQGSPAPTNPNPFVDVASSTYYYNAIRWANSVGVVEGFTDTAFVPENSITREQMAAMMYRYANYLGLNTTQRASLSRFQDNGSISPYAADAISWAVAVGLMDGVTDTSLAPQSVATRGQCAAIIQRFMTNVM